MNIRISYTTGDHDKIEVPLDEVVVENLPEEYLNKNRVPPNEQHHGKDNVF